MSPPAITTILAAVEGARGRTSLLLLTIAILIIALLVRRIRKGGFTVAVVGICVACAAAWLLLVTHFRLARQAPHSIVSVTREGPESFLKTPYHAETSILVDKGGGRLMSRSAVRTLEEDSPCPSLALARPVDRESSDCGDARAGQRSPPQPPSARRPGFPAFGQWQQKWLGRHWQPELSRRHIPPLWTVISGVVLAVMIYLAYLFLDAGTRGQFTWPLRLFAVLAFVGICVFLVLCGCGF
jgi:hypothetical protein